MTPDLIARLARQFTPVPPVKPPEPEQRWAPPVEFTEADEIREARILADLAALTAALDDPLAAARIMFGDTP